MVWAFIFLTLGAVAYTVYLILEHVRDASMLEGQVRRTQAAQVGVEVQIKDCEGARDLARTRVQEMEQGVKEIEATLSELQALISGQKKDMAKRGRFRV